MKEQEQQGQGLNGGALPEFLTPGEVDALLARWGLGGRWYRKKLTEAGELVVYPLPRTCRRRYRSEELLRLREKVRDAGNH